MSTQKIRYFKLTLKQIEDLVWEAILKHHDDREFSKTWLRIKIIEREKKNKVQKE